MIFLKVKIGVSLDDDLVSWLSVVCESRDISRSRFINHVLLSYRSRSSEVLSTESLSVELCKVHDLISNLDSRLSDLECVDPDDISESLPVDVPLEVRGWIESLLESKGYIRWKDDKASWESLEVGDSRRSFSSYMKDCGLVYVRKGNKWTLGGDV